MFFGPEFASYSNEKEKQHFRRMNKVKEWIRDLVSDDHEEDCQAEVQ